MPVVPWKSMGTNKKGHLTTRPGCVKKNTPTSQPEKPSDLMDCRGEISSCSLYRRGVLTACLDVPGPGSSDQW